MDRGIMPTPQPKSDPTNPQTPAATNDDGSRATTPDPAPDAIVRNFGTPDPAASEIQAALAKLKP